MTSLALGDSLFKSNNTSTLHVPRKQTAMEVVQGDFLLYLIQNLNASLEELGQGHFQKREEFCSFQELVRKLAQVIRIGKEDSILRRKNFPS